MKKKLRITLFITLSLLILVLIIIYFGIKIKTNKTYILGDSLPSGSLILTTKTNSSPNRFDIIVYRHPTMDTILTNTYENYYTKIRENRYSINERDLKVVPLEERELWLGRCIAIPGDRLKMTNSKIFVNDKLYNNPNILFNVITTIKDNNYVDRLKSENIKLFAIEQYQNGIRITTTAQNIEKIKNLSIFNELTNIESTEKTFPYSTYFNWNIDNFGELTIPKKNVPLIINISNIALYRRLIEVYENCTLTILDEDIFINGVKTNSFTPKQDYYFILNDNLHGSDDSRYWGFLPENHLYGRVYKLF